jgi:phosphoribosylformylglycinamidine synthase
MKMGFRAENDVIVLLDGHATAPTDAAREFSSSEYARTMHNIVGGAPPAIDLAAESRLIELLVAAASHALLSSAHDLGDGGLAVALAESCFTSDGLSARVSLASEEPAEIALFGERGARAIVSVSRTHLARLLALAAQCQVVAREIGVVAKGDFRIELNSRPVVSADIPSLAGEWAAALQRAIEKT